MMLSRNSATSVQTQHPLAEIYLKLMRDSHLWTDGLDSALRVVIATANEALGTQRVGLWSFGPDRQTLTLMLGYNAAEQSFKHGAELRGALFPEYLRHLESVQVDAISDVQCDPRLREFVARGMVNRELKAMVNSTVRVASRSWGLLVVSDFVEVRLWSEWERWFIASTADLIAQLITYAEIHRSEHWLRFLVDNLPIGVLRFDLDARCEYANPHWQRLTACATETAYGEGWLQCVHPEDRAAMFDKVRMVGVSGERDDIELRLIARDKTIWVACTWVSERNVEGMPIAILGTFVDVTHERTLRENEQRYRALFDNSGDAILVMQGEDFIDCNARALEMFACTREQIIRNGPPSYHFSTLYQPDGRLSQEKALEKITAALRGERQFFEWRHTRFDGTPFLAEVTLTCVSIGDKPYMLAVERDISQRKAAEDALKQSNARLDRINRIAARLYGLRDVEAVALASVEILSEHGSAPLARFFVYDAATHVATLMAQRDGGGQVLPSAGHAVQWTLQSTYDAVADVDLVTDIDALPTTTAMRNTLRERGTRSLIYIWLRGETARIGLIVLEYREVIALESGQREDLIAIGKAVSMALSNVLFISRTEHQATHDILTGLPNRVLLQRELQMLDAEPTCASGLLLLDLDRFKEVNDTLGHNLGDQLLIILAQRLAAMAREKNAFLCRLGGDEFAILMRDVTSLQLQATAELLLELLRQPFQIDDLILEIGGSIGIAVFPQQSASGAELLRLADVAMYQAKRDGGGCALYDRQFDSYTPERLALMQEMRGAISKKQMLLYYQPKLNLRGGGAIDGFEALVRWQHPQRGLLTPAAFLPLAEMGDVIHALTIEVLEQALMQQRAWLQRGLRYSIAVNLSARNLINEQCFIRLRQLIEKYESDANLLELEITETALMRDPLGAAKLLASLTSLGIKFSIDDFGTGYSSLAYLRQLPIHALKIDRTFVCDMVRNEQDAMIVKSTIALAHNLQLDVIAEGVEDEATLAMLRGMSCDYAQGYYISKPQSAAAIDQWLMDR